MKEQQTKYPWHLAPDWAMWAATDENGWSYWFDIEPDHSTYMVGYWGYNDNTVCKYKEIGYIPELRDDWQNSLEKRPAANVEPTALLHGVCTNCENAVAKPLHPCPYKQEVDGDHVSLCNCCNNCEMTCTPFST